MLSAIAVCGGDRKDCEVIARGAATTKPKTS